jgi:hypothetical protein
MKAYVITSGTIFGLLGVVHLIRAIQEGAHLASDPWFAGITVLAFVLCFWAFRSLRQASRLP